MASSTKCRAKNPSACSVHGEAKSQESKRVREIMSWIADDEDGWTTTTTDIASDRTTPEPVLRELAKGYMAVVVAENPATPADVLHVLATETPTWCTNARDARGAATQLREAVARNPNTAPETLVALSNIYDSSSYHKDILAENPNTPADVLAGLDPAHVSANHAAPPQLLRNIYTDLLEYGEDMVMIGVSRHLASNPNTPADVLADIAHNMNSVTFSEEGYADEELYAEHRALVAANRSVPQNVLLKLARDEHETVQAAAVSNPAFATTVQAVARRRGISEPEKLPVDMLASLLRLR